MDSNNYNIIKPVEQTQNITKMKPINKREKRKQKYSFNKQDSQKSRIGTEPVLSDSATEEENSQNSLHTIDYQA